MFQMMPEKLQKTGIFLEQFLTVYPSSKVKSSKVLGHKTSNLWFGRNIIPFDCEEIFRKKLGFELFRYVRITLSSIVFFQAVFSSQQSIRRFAIGVQKHKTPPPSLTFQYKKI